MEMLNKLSFLEDDTISKKLQNLSYKIGTHSPCFCLLIISNVFIQNSTRR